MNGKAEGKNAKDDAAIRKQEINDAIKTIGTRATWMLGILVVIILGVASYIFSDIGVEAPAGSFYRLAWVTGIVLCLIHLALLLYYIQPLVVPNFNELFKGHQGGMFSQESLDKSAERLEKLVKNFKRLIFLFVVSVPASLSIGLALWHFTS